jgi:hypothetical protein
MDDGGGRFGGDGHLFFLPCAEKSLEIIAGVPAGST